MLDYSKSGRLHEQFGENGYKIKKTASQNPKQSSQTNKLGIKWVASHQPQTMGVMCIFQKSGASSMINQIGEKWPKMKEEPASPLHHIHLKCKTI